MTFTLNGIGTSYFRRRNLKIKAGVCSSCHRNVQLASYDTTKVFVVLFIPMIPLGEYHILDHCPSCTVHRAIPVKDWEHHSTTSLAQALAAFRAQPNAQTAHALLGLQIDLGLRESYENTLSEVESKAGEDPNYWAILGHTARSFGDTTNAIRYFQRSQQLGNIPWVRTSLVLLLLETGRIEEARGCIGPVELDGTNTPLVLSLVESFLSAGRHEDALFKLRDLVTARPQMGNDKRVQKLRKTAERHRGTGKRLKQFQPGRPSFSTSWIDQAFSIRPVYLVLGLIVVGLMLISFGFWGYFQWTRVNVFLLNGLPYEYQVQYGEQQIGLRPGEPNGLELPLHEKVTLAVDYGALQENIELELDVTWSEFFSSRTVVVNPDRLATLGLEDIVYVREGNSPPEEPNKTEFFSGESVYRWSSIEYPFVPVPETIEIKGSHRQEVRQNLWVQPLDPANHLSFMRAQMGLSAAEAALDRRLELTPEVEEKSRLEWYSRLPPESFKKRAAAELAADPPRVAWHRAYQSLPEHASQEAALVAEYRARLSTRPDDPDGLYLLGRLLIDKDEARSLYNQALRSGKEAPWALYGLGWLELTTGNFESALGLTRRASLAGSNASFEYLLAETMMAVGDLRGAAEIHVHSATAHTALWAAIGEEERIPETLEPFYAGMSIGDRRSWQPFFESGVCYPQGLACFEEKLKDQELPLARFWLGLIRRDAKLASESLGLDDSDIQAHLTLATIFPTGPEGRQHLKAAVDLLMAEGFDEAIAAKALNGENYQREDLLGLVMEPEIKSIILCRVGRATGDREMLDLAAKLLYRPSLTQLLIRRELES